MKKIKWIILIVVFLFISCGPGRQSQNFTFQETKQGVQVLDAGKPVLFYQREPKPNQEEFTFNNYIHPLYGFSGDTVTEEFPIDHIHHRGIYWAWHQVFVAGQSVGDAWTMTNIKQEVSSVTTENTGRIISNSYWTSSLYKDRKPFISEKIEISIQPRKKKYRAIDFRISLTALVPEVEIGGSADEKGYGGFCVRIKHQDQIVFTSPKGKITPQNLQIDAGSWMDFSGPIGTNGDIEGLAIICHPETPNFPAPWILRSEPSMQNIVYPGRSRIVVPTDILLTLCYRIVIHDGDASNIDIDKLQLEYRKK